MSVQSATDLLVQNRAEHWADVDNRPIDFGTTTLPPQLLTLTDPQIKANNDAFQKFMTNQDLACQSDIPEEKLLEGHIFWGARKNSWGLLRWVLIILCRYSWAYRMRYTGREWSPFI